MRFQLMRLEIDLRVKHHEFLLQTFAVRTQKMVLFEVLLQCIIIEEILLRLSPIPPIADMAALVLVPAVCVELVVAVEAQAAEAAFGVAFEAALVDGAGVIVAEFLVFSEFGGGEELVLVGEDFLVAGAKVAGGESGGRLKGERRRKGYVPHLPAMRCLDMAM